jgi:general secretion pathway protein K
VTTTARRIASRPCGFALVIVLWSMGLLALLGTRLTTTTRVQLHLAMQGRDQAMAEAAADGAIRETMFLLLGGLQVGAADWQFHRRIGGVDVRIQIEDESSKINPNFASRDVLRGLMVSVGVDQPGATLLSGEIADWRVRTETSVLGGAKIDRYRDHGLPYRWGGRGFTSVDEIGLIPDMTPEILARLRPWLSVYHEGGVTDPTGGSLASAAVADARLANRVVEPTFSSQNIIVHVTAAASVAGRAKFVRSAVLRLRGNRTSEAGAMRGVIQVLTWE